MSPVKLSKKPVPKSKIISIVLLINRTEIPNAIGTSMFNNFDRRLFHFSI